MAQMPDFPCGTCEGFGTITRAGQVVKCPSCVKERAPFDTAMINQGFTLVPGAAGVTASLDRGMEHRVHRNKP